MTDQTPNLLHAFALLSKGAARKKIYSLKAQKDGRKNAALLLRAFADSEAAQSRRLLSLSRGNIDNSDQFLTSIFEKEIPEICSNYQKLTESAEAAGLTSLLFSLRQLRNAEKSMLRFYDDTNRDITANETKSYFVCQFCGYIAPDHAPENCPICGAKQQAFKEIDE